MPRVKRRAFSVREPGRRAVSPAGPLLAAFAALSLLVGTDFSRFSEAGDTPPDPVLLLTADGTRAVTLPDGRPDSLVPLTLEPVHGGVTQAWRMVPEARDGEGVFALRNLRSGKVMDVRGYGMADGDPVQQFRYFGSRNQRWRSAPAGDGAVSLQVLHSGKCLSIAADEEATPGLPGEAPSIGPNAILVQRICTGATDQRWRVVPDPEAERPFRLVSRHGGMALSLEKDDPADGVKVVQMPVAPSPLQIWTRFSRGHVNGEPVSVIVSAHAGKVLDVRGDSQQDRADIQQFSFNGGPNQLWHLWASGDGYWQVVSAGSGKCLDIRDESRLAGARVQQYACNGGPNQLWRMENVSLEGLFPSDPPRVGIHP